MAMMTKIYALCSPTAEIRYIGKTVNSLVRRLGSHLYVARRGDQNHLYNWLRSVLSTGHLPLIQLIGEVIGNGNNEERAWIIYGKGEGWRLVNSTSGGEGILNPSEETRRKLHDSHVGKPNGCLGTHRSEESRLKMSLAKKGKHFTKEHRRKIGLGNKGKIISIDQRRKISKANRNRIVSIETRQKLSKLTKTRLAQNGHPLSGKHHSEESKRRMSESHKGEKHFNYGKHLSEETRRKIGLANLGRHQSAETRQKISEATLRQFAAKGHPRQGCHASDELKCRMSETTKKRMTPEYRKKISNSLLRYFQSKRVV